MNDDVVALTAAADARWKRLASVLTSRRDAPLHGCESAWLARDEYAHIARWMGVTVERMRVALAAEPPPGLDRDHYLRWQAEDRPLSLAAARARAEAARDELLALVAATAAGDGGDGLRAMAAGDLVAHLDEHFGFLVAGLLADEARTWTALAARLDARPAGTLYAGDGVAWSARDVYAHLARWFDFGTQSLETVRDARPMTPLPDFDAANREWLADDAALELDEARQRAVDGRERMLAIARALTPEQWTAPGFDRLDGNGYGHYREHLEYLDS